MHSITQRRNISRQVLESADFLCQMLGKGRRRSKIRLELLGKATPDQLFAFVEFCYIFRYRVPLLRQQQRLLAKHRSELLALSRVKTPRSARRLLLRGEQQQHPKTTINKRQIGRGLPALATVISSILLPIIKEYI
jgi:hypothetical protein